MNDGDLLSYAAVSIQSHGFQILVDFDFAVGARVEGTRLSLPDTATEFHDPISIALDCIDKLVMDPRRESASELIMVFRASADQHAVMTSLHEQLAECLGRLAAAYETLAANAVEMREACKLKSHTATSYICKTAPIGAKKKSG